MQVEQYLRMSGRAEMVLALHKLRKSLARDQEKRATKSSKKS